MAAVYERDGSWLPVPKPIPLRLAIRGALLNALAYYDGRQTEAAAALALTPRQMCYQLKIHGIPGQTTGTGKRPGKRPIRPVARRWRRPRVNSPAVGRARILGLLVLLTRLVHLPNVLR